MPIRPVVAAVVALTSVNPKTLFFTRTGMTVPSTTRSKPSSSTAAQHSGATQRGLPTLGAPLVIVVPGIRSPLWSGRLREVHRGHAPSRFPPSCPRLRVVRASSCNLESRYPFLSAAAPRYTPASTQRHANGFHAATRRGNDSVADLGSDSRTCQTRQLEKASACRVTHIIDRTSRAPDEPARDSAARAGHRHTCRWSNESMRQVTALGVKAVARILNSAASRRSAKQVFRSAELIP